MAARQNPAPSPSGAAPAAPGEGLGDFDSLMSDLGATPVSAAESELAIKDATIDELQRNLLDLRSLGDHLAQTEKARLALESQLAEQRLEIAQRTEAHHAEIAKWQDAYQRAEQGRIRAEERMRKVRAKFEKRDRVATERWHKMRALQQERKELQAELKRLLREQSLDEGSPSGTGGATGGRPSGPSSLMGLFDPDPHPESATRSELGEIEVEPHLAPQSIQRPDPGRASQ